MKRMVLTNSLTMCVLLICSIHALDSLEDIVVGARYTMNLLTGDVLEGTVESKTDTSLIMDCDGEGYVFRMQLIRDYELIAMPKKEKDAGPPPGEGVVSFGDLKHPQLRNREIEITLDGGRTFRGILLTVSESGVKLNVDGSQIPIAQTVIDKIYVYPTVEDAVEEPAGEPKDVFAPPFDTVHVRNPEVDEWGNRGDDLIYWGKVISEDAQQIVLRMKDGEEKTIYRNSIIRLDKHSSDSFLGSIQRYAAPLICPSDMALVDVPPGVEGRPFFKSCIDKYEYPGKQGRAPRANVSYGEASRLCREQGKRLCTATEWQWACGGLEQYVYPYGNSYDEKACNTETSANIELSGARAKCLSKFGVYDMVGNVFEWVIGENGDPVLMGGPYSKCSTRSPGGGGRAKPLNGFRCCRSN